jgi:hypothetical protein
MQLEPPHAGRQGLTGQADVPLPQMQQHRRQLGNQLPVSQERTALPFRQATERVTGAEAGASAFG